MSLASLTVEVAFEKGLTETAADGDFTTISTDNPVVNFRITRGRGHELEVTQAGVATVICQNTNGYLDPSNESSPSPYYDGGNNVLPGRHLRIKAQDPETSTTYVIFRGFVERWIQKYPGETNQQVVIDCADAFKALALAFCDGSTEADDENSGTRIANLLDQASWPSGAGYRDIDATAANETVPEKTYATTGAVMAACQAIETAEIGSFFVSRSGAMTFKNRVNRISEFATISATFSDTDVLRHVDGGRSPQVLRPRLFVRRHPHLQRDQHENGHGPGGDRHPANRLHVANPVRDSHQDERFVDAHGGRRRYGLGAIHYWSPVGTGEPCQVDHAAPG